MVGDATAAGAAISMWGSRWMTALGQTTLPSPRRCSDRQAVQWLAERPARWPGPWGLGCVFCADFMKRLEESDARAQAARFRTKWARYDVRVPTLQASQIHQHLGHECHKLASEAFLRPDTPVRVILQPQHGDEGLLHGAVPQPADWLRAWRAVKSPVAYSTAQEFQETEHYIRCIRRRPVQRRAVQSQVAIMAEVTRKMKRHWIQHAWSITIALDDKGPYRLIRFKADCLQNVPESDEASEVGEAAPAREAAPRADGAGEAAPHQHVAGEAAPREDGAGEAAPHQHVAGEAAPREDGTGEAAPHQNVAGEAAPREDGAGEAAPHQHVAGEAAQGDDASDLAQWGASTCPHPGACSGVLGVVRPHHDADVEEFDEDYSERMCETIVAAIHDLCTPFGEPRDDGLVQHFLQHVRVYMSDGAKSAQKCGELLRRWCPNLLIVGRDPTHAIRIACRDPLHLEERFEEQWERLFNRKHALIADIQNSDQLRARLAACQRRVLRVDNQQGGSLTSILKHFSFVKTRFESFVGPRRKYICLLQAIVMLLCSIADDQRMPKDRRDRAEAALDAITPSDVIACGLAADYSEICLAFVRKSDTNNHDPALSAAEKDEFVATLRDLFLDGYIFAKPEDDAVLHRFSGGLVQAKTLTRIACEQMEPMRVFYYGHKTKVLWSRTAADEAKAALASMQHAGCGQGRVRSSGHGLV